MQSSRCTWVYLSCADTKAILIYSMDRAEGTLAQVGRVEVPGTAIPSPVSMPLAVSPSRRFLYAALRSDPFPVVSFAIDAATGGLDLVAASSLPAGMSYIATAGQYLLGASFPGDLVSLSVVDPDGAIREPARSVVVGCERAHCIVPDATGRFAYAAILGGDAIAQFRIDAALGRLVKNDPARVETGHDTGPRHLTFHPRAARLFNLNELSGTIDAFRADPQSGLLERYQTVETVPVAAGVERPPLPPGVLFDPHSASGADIHITPDGLYLYASVRSVNHLFGYAMDQLDFTLRPIGKWPTEACPRGFGIDPRGRFMLVAGQLSNTVAVLSIDTESGALAKTAEYRTEANPNWIEIVDV